MGTKITAYLSDKIKEMKASEIKEAWLTLDNQRLRIVPPTEDMLCCDYPYFEALIKNRGNIHRVIVTKKDGLHFTFSNGKSIMGHSNKILALIAEAHERSAPSLRKEE